MNFEQQMKRAIVKYAMAIDPSVWQKHIDENPYGYHWTDYPDEIAEQGLLPNHSENQYVPEMASRRNHVYMLKHHSKGSLDGPAADAHGLVKVDLRKLDPNNIVADEDYFQKGHPRWKQDFEYTPEQEYLYKGDWAEQHAHHFDSPEITRKSIESIGTFAHRGAIPPSAIAQAKVVRGLNCDGTGNDLTSENYDDQWYSTHQPNDPDCPGCAPPDFDKYKLPDETLERYEERLLDARERKKLFPYR